MARVFIIFVMFLVVAANKHDCSLDRDDQSCSEGHLQEIDISIKDSCRVDSDDPSCSSDVEWHKHLENKYSEEANTQWSSYLHEIEQAETAYKPCDPQKCSCHYGLIKKDLNAFAGGISHHMITTSKERGLHFMLNYLNFYFPKYYVFSKCSTEENKKKNYENLLNSRRSRKNKKEYFLGDFGEKHLFMRNCDCIDITSSIWCNRQRTPTYLRNFECWLIIVREKITTNIKIYT
ncbi:unnamed protein product, partial [Meganyctiphanes norvegica]